MPELPEVETVRKGLEPHLAGARLVRVEQRRADLRFPFPDDFVARLSGATVLRLERRAKYLIAPLDTGETLVAHLGMTGRFLVGERMVGEGGFVMSPDFKFEMSFVISLEKATIVYDCRHTPAFQVCPAKGGCITPKIESGDGYSREIAHFVKRITGKKTPDVITPLDSLNAVKIVLAEKQSAESKKEVAIR